MPSVLPFKFIRLSITFGYISLLDLGYIQQFNYSRNFKRHWKRTKSTGHTNEELLLPWNPWKIHKTKNVGERVEMTNSSSDNSTEFFVFIIDLHMMTMSKLAPYQYVSVPCLDFPESRYRFFQITRSPNSSTSTVHYQTVLNFPYRETSLKVVTFHSRTFPNKHLKPRNSFDISNVLPKNLA